MSFECVSQYFVDYAGHAANLIHYVAGLGGAEGTVSDVRLLPARNGNSHCFIEFLEETAARRALCCTGALLGRCSPR